MDLHTENKLLRRKLEELTVEARTNESVSRRCHERELDLLTAETLAELLGSLTDGLMQSFALDDLGLVLLDADHEMRHLLRSTGVSPEAFPSVRFADDLQALSPVYARLKRIWLGPFLSDEHGKLFAQAQPLSSVALLPLLRCNRLIGSLNLGSHDPQRFTRHHGSDFLRRLATVGALCLENATHRERLLLTGFTDTLTGLHNRRYLERRLKEELTRAGRYRLPLSCLFLDVDHFKQVNDTHGHAAGDRVLQELAQRMRTCLRASDVATRYGGEEFALVLPQTGVEEAGLLAERIRLEVAGDPVILADSGLSIDIRVSIGVSESLPGPRRNDFGALAKQLLTEADSALYRAKETGRNRVVSYPQPANLPLLLSPKARII